MTKRFLILFFLIFFSLLYAAERVVTIESARSTEYLKSGEGEIIRFSGSVVIVVTEGSSVSRIGADEITYDKKSDTLEAHGNVEYSHSTGKTSVEKFSGESLLFNINKQEGVFLDGTVTQETGKKSSDPYIIHSEASGRDSSSTMAFKNGVLTTCTADEPHWSINASRIWLLPGNEIAILNGIFFIGPLPVFYIPVFYYPSDEMIVHPVFGFRNREGYFVQTTSYLIGRKPLPVKSSSTTGNSFSDFLQGDILKEQKREGLFFRNLEADAQTTNTDYLKLKVDAYSSLGTLVGLDGFFSPESYIKSINFSADFGLSRTLYPSSSYLNYSTYNSDGVENYNSGWFYGNELPLRYRFNYSMTMEKKPFKISIALPMISDPYFKYDFLNRSEDLNWFKFLKDQDTLAKTTTVTEESSFSWNINGSINPDVSFFNPWVQTVSISNISGLLTFNSKPNGSIAGTEITYSPERKLFYPEVIKPEFSISIGGTLYSSEQKSDTEKIVTSDTSPLTDPFKQVLSENQSVSANDSENTKETVNRYIPSAGSGLVPSVIPATASYAITWSIDPSVVQETRYDATLWDSPDDINWNKYSSLYYQLKTNAKLQGIYAWDTNFFTASSILNFTGTQQDHPFLSESVYTETAADSIRVNDYTANVFGISTTESIQCMPFNRNLYFKPIALSWNFTGTVLRNVFSGTADAPDWKIQTFDWSKSYVSVHTATAVFGISLANYIQKISVTSNLAPLLQSYTGSAGFAWPFGTMSMNSRLFEQENSAKTWYWDPFTVLLNWNLPFGILLGQEYVYSIEEDSPSRLSFTGSKGFFSAYYTLNNTIPYQLSPSGWILNGTTKEFLPSAAGFTFNNSSKPFQLYAWKNRLFVQANFSSNFKVNLLKLTDSSLDFVPTITFKLSEFLDISFSSNSRNDVIARYFQSFIALPAPLGGETNMLVDLFKSFNFSNLQDRTESGFKLKSLNVTLTHYLHDWTMNFTTSVSPVLNTTSSVYRYDFVPTVVFLVQWKPISDIKTTVKSEKGIFTLNTTDTPTTTQ